jgi:HEAT repeat protein
MADDAVKDSEAHSPPPYKGKTAKQWIDQLARSHDPRARAAAAEALGFMARDGRQTFGGFSDVPIDSPEPPKLGEEALRPIVAALVAGMDDPNERVRASSAVAVSWIGPRAKAAVAALIRRFDDGDEEVRKNAVRAIGRIGTAAKEATSHLEAILARGDAHHRVDVAGALRMVGAVPDSYVPALVEILAQDGFGSAAHYAAMELAHLGDPAVAALKKAFKDKHPTTRKNAAYAIANMAGWGKLTKDREAVAHALNELARDDDPRVVWAAAQAIGSVHASPERCVPTLVSLLKHKDQTVVEQAAESLGEFGAQAKPALPALTKLLGERKDETVSADYAIREIGIDRVSAEAIRTLKFAERGSWLFLPLCEYPDVALEFLEKNPHVVDVPVRDRDGLTRLMRNPDPRLKPLQEALYKNEQLPLAIIARLREARFLPLLQRRLKTAGAHEKTKLEACARACGSPAERVVTISEAAPGDFKPKSAWPGTDSRRMDPKVLGHGDGLTEVIITGRILRDGGVPAIAPKFYRINDAMLLGERTRDEVPFTFDARTGRFVFVTHVFAAYSSGDGQPEPGPYQTGSSMVLIESEGCKPLQVRFYDEMPEIRITLSVRDKGAGK